MVQTVTFAVAVLGAVLGVINTWHNLDKSRVKLRVRPAHAIPVGAADQRIELSIEISNLSAFAVSVSEAGVLYSGTRNRGAIINPLFANGGGWPRRLEPRSSITVYSHLPPAHGRGIKCAYARTECGVIKTGTSPALKQMAREQEL